MHMSFSRFDNFSKFPSTKGYDENRETRIPFMIWPQLVFIMPSVSALGFHVVNGLNASLDSGAVETTLCGRWARRSGPKVVVLMLLLGTFDVVSVDPSNR